MTVSPSIGSLQGLTPPIRVRLEDDEEARLSPHAKLAKHSAGRERLEEPCPMRTAFMRDRDRIVHSKSFRRLKHKTQVFLAPTGDHYRTRLTHTLEVTQISRAIARSLALNEDLTEAIALGHDLGHTPFGHIGEDALSSTKYATRTFRHNEQSVRVVEAIEYGGKGLNLTAEVRDGILNHSGDGCASSLEGQVVKIADRIAYVNHDIDDAIRAGVLSAGELPPEAIEIFGIYPSQRINSMVQDLVAASLDQSFIRMSPVAWTAMMNLREFMFDQVYTASPAKTENEKAMHVLRSIFEYYWENPSALPEEFQPVNANDEAELGLRVTDYVAGMTDHFVLTHYEKLFLPRVWTV